MHNFEKQLNEANHRDRELNFIHFFFLFYIAVVLNYLQVKDKIVVFDDMMADVTSWKIAESAGAAAIVLRSVVSTSNYSLYARAGEPANKRTINIPVATITNEDADLLRGLYAQGKVSHKIYLRPET